MRLPHLGKEFVPDFIIGDVGSVGFRWVLIELETPRSGIQGSSLFQDAQSGEESTDLRCVSAKCLRDVGYAHGPQQADRRISEGSHHFRTGTRFPIRLASSPIVTSRT